MSCGRSVTCAWTHQTSLPTVHQSERGSGCLPCLVFLGSMHDFLEAASPEFPLTETLLELEALKAFLKCQSVSWVCTEGGICFPFKEKVHHFYHILKSIYDSPDVNLLFWGLLPSLMPHLWSLCEVEGRVPKKPRIWEEVRFWWEFSLSKEWCPRALTKNIETWSVLALIPPFGSCQDCTYHQVLYTAAARTSRRSGPPSPHGVPPGRFSSLSWPGMGGGEAPEV